MIIYFLKEQSSASENYFPRFKGKSYIFQWSHWYCVCMSSWEHAPNMEPLQMCVWLRCCGHWLLPFPINLAFCITLRFPPAASSECFVTLNSIAHMECFASFWWYAEEREREGEEGEEQGKWRQEETRREMPNTKEKTPAQVVWTEDCSHDLNILGDETCPRCRDSFLSKTCSFSRLSDAHQWSIVAAICDCAALLCSWFYCSKTKTKQNKKKKHCRIFKKCRFISESGSV